MITGAAIRIGKAIAQAFANRGYELAIHYNRSAQEAQGLHRVLTEQGVPCELFSADLNDPAQYADLIERARQRFSNLQVLVNSASIFENALLKDTEEDLLERHLSINLKAPMRLSRDFARQISPGHIINILDQRIEGNHPSYFAYTVSKKALADVMQMSAVELAPDIRVNGIAPGFILPPPGAQTSSLLRLRESIPLRRQGTLDNIRQAVYYLLDNDYVTGQILYVDGGEHLVR